MSKNLKWIIRPHAVASSEDLDKWLERIISASTIEDLFE